ncbi:MAG: ATP-binding protein [Luteibaculum sp.]
MDKIFQVFQSGIGARKSGHQGMGLARAKKIIETHLGSIWAKSEYDVGSIFHIVLPLN